MSRTKVITDRAGTYRINRNGKDEYKTFVPAPLPPTPEIVIDEEMIELLVNAESRIRAVDEIAAFIPNMNQYMSMYVRKEALASSQIEGTQATLEDVLDASIDTNVNADVEEVVNYVRAINFAMNRMDALPLSNRLIRETHGVLMEGVRGSKKTPGEFRRSQNWLGAPGSTIMTARYVPPVLEDMKEALSDLELFMHDVTNGYDLIAAALIHYQFETIHPFLDGNGRMGRMLIMLYLLDRGKIHSPIIYPSYYLKANQAEYYDRLELVRTQGNYEQWVKFFLKCIAESAEDSMRVSRNLIDLHNSDYAKVEPLGKRAVQLFDYLEEHPIIEIGTTAKALGMSYNTLSSLLEKLTECGIIEQVDKQKRNRKFMYKQYVNVLKGE